MADERYTINVQVPAGVTEDSPEWQDFLGTVGGALVEHVADHRFQTGGDGTWPATHWPRVAQLIDDIERGSIRLVTMDEKHQTGVVSGDLRASIQFETRAGEIALLFGGGGVDYAERFHRGGQSSKRIDQANLRRLYHKNSAFKRFLKIHKLGWLFALSEVEFDQPARPLITEPGIREVVAAEARSAWPELN